jgi:hypothetical protein
MNKPITQVEPTAKALALVLCPEKGKEQRSNKIIKDAPCSGMHAHERNHPIGVRHRTHPRG